MEENNYLILLKKLWQRIKKSLHIMFFPITLLYIVFYFLYKIGLWQASLLEYDTIITYGSKLALYGFSISVFAGALKYVQLLKIFKEDFEKIVVSSAFKKALKDEMSQIVFSDDFLSKQNDLDDKWKRITLCRFKKNFPELFPKLGDLVENTFFVDYENIQYYKNYQVCYDISRHNDSLVKIVDRTSFTLVRPDKKEFEWKCQLSCMQEENSEKGSAFKLSINEELLDVNDKRIKVKDIEEKDGIVTKEVTCIFSNHLEYHIGREITIIQDLKEDQEYSFSSRKIIDDITVKVKHSNDINVSFSECKGNKFYLNPARGDENISKINRTMFLPGGIYKLFIS